MPQRLVLAYPPLAAAAGALLGAAVARAAYDKWPEFRVASYEPTTSPSVALLATLGGVLAGCAAGAGLLAGGNHVRPIARSAVVAAIMTTGVVAGGAVARSWQFGSLPQDAVRLSTWAGAAAGGFLLGLVAVGGLFLRLRSHR